MGKTINLCSTKNEHCISQRPEGQKPQWQAQGKATTINIHTCVVRNTLCRSAGRGNNQPVLKKMNIALVGGQETTNVQQKQQQENKKIIHLCEKKNNVIQLLEQTGCTTNAEKDDQGKRTCFDKKQSNVRRWR